MTEARAGLSVAVIGATGAVGEALLSVLVERNFPIGKLYALGRAKPSDYTAMYNERPVRVENIDDFDFSHCQIAFFCARKAIAKKYAPRAVKSGCWVIDVSSQFRLDAKTPLVVPEINGDCLAALSVPQIIAGPSAQAVQASIALFPLQQQFGLRRADITTFLAASALGKAGVAELAGQTARLLNVQAIDQKLFPAQIAFNLLPAFDASTESGYTLEESNGAKEVKKLLKAEQLDVVMSQAFAPVFYGHSQIVRLETTAACSASQVRTLLAATGVEFADTPDELLSPVALGTSSDALFVSRYIQSEANSHQLELWTVADNIRKGAAINSVAIAEALLKSHL